MERPILFSAPMVRAILECRKTQTRRVIKPVQPRDDGMWPAGRDPVPDCLYGHPGDRLWVREACRAEELTAEAAIIDEFVNCDDEPIEGLDGVRYLADNHFEPIENTSEAADAWGELNAYRGKRGATVPPIHMPRWASRITLEITDVRVQRVQDISEADALAEGCRSAIKHSAAFADIWDSINAKRGFGWNANPWVWALTFKRVEE